jgi:prefoldin subunit 5
MAHILRQIGNLQSAHSQYNKAIDALEKLKKDEQKSKDCVKMLMEARHSLKQLIKETQM